MTPEQASALVALEPSYLTQVASYLQTHGPLPTRRWLERSHPVEVCLGLLDCLTCQAHFAQKFEQAARWLLSREAAEQATPSAIASWRAAYLRGRFPGADRLRELGTGVGGDSVYLARHFSLSGYERDPARAILARENVRRLSPNAAHLELRAHALELDSLGETLLFADPARRGASRTFDPERWEPPLSLFFAATSPHGFVVKTAPGLDLLLLPEGVEAHFLSLAGELKEAMLLGPAASQPAAALRHAWLFSGHGPPLHRYGESRPAPLRDLRSGEFLHNPDPSVVRSGLLAQLAGELSSGLVHPKIAYLCGPVASPNGWATSFAVVDSFPLQWKKLQQALLASPWSEIEILSRGVPFSQAELHERTQPARKKMKRRSGGRGSLIVYRDSHGYTAVLAQRQRPQSGTGNESSAVESLGHDSI